MERCDFSDMTWCEDERTPLKEATRSLPTPRTWLTGEVRPLCVERWEAALWAHMLSSSEVSESARHWEGSCLFLTTLAPGEGQQVRIIWSEGLRANGHVFPMEKREIGATVDVITFLTLWG